MRCAQFVFNHPTALEKSPDRAAGNPQSGGPRAGAMRGGGVGSPVASSMAAYRKYSWRHWPSGVGRYVELYSGHYAQVATMRSSHKQVVASPGVARYSAVSVGVELDIVSAAECSGGPASGDRHGEHSIISDQPRRRARQRAARAARRCDQAVPDKRRFRVPDSLKEYLQAPKLCADRASQECAAP